MSIIWELIQKTSPYVAIRLTKKDCLLLMTIFERDEVIIKSRIQQLKINMNALLPVLIAYSQGLQLTKLIGSGDYMINDGIKHSSGPDSATSLVHVLKRMNFPFPDQQEPKLISEEVIGIQTVFKSALAVQSFTILGSLTSTLKAILNIGGTVIMGSSDCGLRQHFAIELTHNEIDSLHSQKEKLLRILKNNPNITGNLIPIPSKFMNENRIRNFIGISPFQITHKISRKIIEEIPDVLDFYPLMTPNVSVD
ncbi:MAG: hypothetical protein ACW98K_07420 [Candidatus Kariarchaeaceae archaeon]